MAESHHRYPWLCHLACIAPTVVMIVGFWAAFATDTSLGSYFRDYREAHRSLTGLVDFFTEHATIVFYLIYAAILFFGFNEVKTKKFVICFLFAFTLTLVAVYVFKGGIGRARPFLEPGFIHWSWGGDDDSFPSGHTTEAVSCALPLAWWYCRRRLAILFGLYAALIALTRIYLGVHFMTDLLGGVVMGSFAGYFSWWLFDRFALTAEDGRGETG